MCVYASSEIILRGNRPFKDVSLACFHVDYCTVSYFHVVLSINNTFQSQSFPRPQVSVHTLLLRKKKKKKSGAEN